MRYTLIILLMSAVGIPCAAQYRPMLKEGKVWNERAENQYYRIDITKRIAGDTIVAGEKCFKLYAKSIGYKLVESNNGKKKGIRSLL